MNYSIPKTTSLKAIKPSSTTLVSVHFISINWSITKPLVKEEGITAQVSNFPPTLVLW